MDTGFPTYIHILDSSEKGVSLQAATIPQKGAESEAETSLQSTQALCRSNSLGQDWGWEDRWEKNGKTVWGTWNKRGFMSSLNIIHDL